MGLVGGGGGVCNVFLTFYARGLFPTFLKKIQNNYYYYFSFNIFFVFFLYAGNIVKCPFTYSYWLNGRWFLQIVDIHVGNFNMNLPGRWFPQIVVGTVGIYIQYIHNKNCGVSF